MGYERAPNLPARLWRSLRTAGGLRAALAALVILGSALGVMRLVAEAPPLPAAVPAPGSPAIPRDSTLAADTADADTADTVETRGRKAADSAGRKSEDSARGQGPHKPG